MILYTMLPTEAVLSDENELNDYVNKQRYVDLDGRHFVVDPISEQEWRIVRLISSNPQDYLDEHYQPGKVIPISPQF